MLGARRSTRTSTSAARWCTAAARSRSAAATRASCGTSPAKATRRGSSRSPPLHKPEDMTEDPDFLFRDITDWSVLDVGGDAPVPLQRPRAASRLGRQLLRHPAIPDGQLRPLRAHQRHASGAAAFRAPGGRPPSSCSATRPTSRRERSRGRTRESQGKSSSHFAPRFMDEREQVGRRRARSGTAPRSRAAWSSARARRASSSCSTGSMTELVREQPFSGRVLGVKASYTPRFDPDTSARLESFWQNGNIDERRATINIRAKMARLHRHRRSRRQSAVPQHVLSRVQRARVRVERMGAARAARPGRQRHHRRHADRRQSCGHAAEPRDHPELPHPAAAGDARHLHRHAARTPDLPVPPLHRHHARAPARTST